MDYASWQAGGGGDEKTESCAEKSPGPAAWVSMALYFVTQVG